MREVCFCSRGSDVRKKWWRRMEGKRKRQVAKESRSTGWICCVRGRVTELCSGLPTFPKYPCQDGTPLHLMWTVLVTKIESLWLSRPTHLSQEHPTGKLCLPSVSRETGENLKQNPCLSVALTYGLCMCTWKQEHTHAVCFALALIVVFETFKGFVFTEVTCKTRV